MGTATEASKMGQDSGQDSGQQKAGPAQPAQAEGAPQEKPEPKGKHRNRKTEARFQELLDQRKAFARRAVELEQKVAAAEQELVPMRAVCQALQDAAAAVPARIAQARERGRKLFVDFDAVISHVSISQDAFLALLASENGPELMYAAGLGVQVLADRQRVEYYRNLHERHFAAVKEGAVN